mmetsp:Transcript_122580/g.357974  ORF Transcript_122580/g.357974 Transcript_122580/m.357974 type:complete len:332 (+) Transcript_122580:464-1459(+)
MSSSVTAPPRKQRRCLAGSSSVARATRPLREDAFTEIQRGRRPAEKRKLHSNEKAVASKPLELALCPKTSVRGLGGGGLPGPAFRQIGTLRESVSPVSTMSTCSVTRPPAAAPGGCRPRAGEALAPRAASAVAPKVAEEPREVARFAVALESLPIILSMRSSGTLHQSLGRLSSGRLVQSISSSDSSPLSSSSAGLSSSSSLCLESSAVRSMASRASPCSSWKRTVRLCPPCSVGCSAAEARRASCSRVPAESWPPAMLPWPAAELLELLRPLRTRRSICSSGTCHHLRSARRSAAPRPGCEPPASDSSSLSSASCCRAMGAERGPGAPPP